MEKIIYITEERHKDLYDYHHEKTGVDFGNLYYHDTKNSKRVEEFYLPTIEESEIKSNLLYDEETGNVHMMPNDLILAKQCSDRILEKGKEIKKYIVKKIKDMDSIQVNFIHPNYKMFKDTAFENSKYLFSYIRVTCNNTKYDLVFNRFYFDENERVNCILPCPQIEICDKLLKDYPYSSENNQASKGKHGGSVYYNLGIDLYSPSDDIAKEFLNFVIDTEKKKQVNDKG